MRKKARHQPPKGVIEWCQWIRKKKLERSFSLAKCVICAHYPPLFMPNFLIRVLTGVKKGVIIYGSTQFFE
jgi:hypothetical protein